MALAYEHGTAIRPWVRRLLIEAATMNLTTKQFGDACEYAVLAELSFAGLPATKMPDGWPGYNLMVGGRADGRISVKGMRYVAKPQGNRFWRFRPNGWDWLAVIRFKEDQTRAIYIAPRMWVLSAARRSNEVLCDLYASTPGLETFRDNFRLETRETLLATPGTRDAGPAGTNQEG